MNTTRITRLGRTARFGAILLALAAAGCGGGGGQSATAARDNRGTLPPSLRQDAAQAVEASQSAASARQPGKANAGAAGGGSSFSIPAGAQFTIYCQTISGPDHVERANRIKQQLVSQAPLKDWYVIHQDGQSTLYYGFYKSFDDPKDADAQRAQRDRRTIDALTDQLGNRPFKFAFFVALDAPDPVAPPEWDLSVAPGEISLQIAAYTGHPLRKQYAVEAVRAARAQGVDAYYYHGENTSSVCVGAWPESAVKRTQEVINARPGDPDQPFVKAGIPLPAEAAKNQRDAQGRPLRVEQERFQIADASLAAMMQRFPEHAVNGEVPMTSTNDPRTGRRVTKPASSFLVPIPKSEPSLLNAGGAAAGAPAGLPADQPIEPFPAARPAPRPGMGQLRGVEPR